MAQPYDHAHECCLNELTKMIEADASAVSKH